MKSCEKNSDFKLPNGIPFIGRLGGKDLCCPFSGRFGGMGLCPFCGRFGGMDLCPFCG